MQMWSEGIIACPTTGEKYKYRVNYHENDSEYGIDGGWICNLYIRKHGEDFGKYLCYYNRGWKTEPAAEVQEVYEKLLQDYN